jgi:hypothetical protein
MQDTTKVGALSRDPVLIAMAVREIAQRLAKPGETSRQTENRIRTRIRDAIVRTRELRLVDDLKGPAVRRADFCEWAFKTWPEVVRELPGYLHNVTVRPGAAAIAVVGQLSAVVVTNPNSLEWLREHYLKAEVERQRFEHENAELRQRVAALEADLEALRTKKILRRDRASEYGKKGGRGHSL